MTAMGPPVVTAGEIGRWRTGPDNDIDIHAVYGGRIPGRRPQTTKLNPLYQAEHCDDHVSHDVYTGIGENNNNIHVDIYQLSTLGNMRDDTKVTALSDEQLEMGEKENGIVTNTASTTVGETNINSDGNQYIRSTSGRLMHVYNSKIHVDPHAHRINKELANQNDFTVDRDIYNENKIDMNAELITSELDNSRQIDNEIHKICETSNENNNSGEVMYPCYQNEGFEESEGDPKHNIDVQIQNSKNLSLSNSDRHSGAITDCESISSQIPCSSQIVTDVFVHNNLQGDIEATLSGSNTSSLQKDSKDVTDAPNPKPDESDLSKFKGEAVSDWPDINDIAVPLEQVQEQSGNDTPAPNFAKRSESKTRFNYESKVNPSQAAVDFSQYIIDNTVVPKSPDIRAATDGTKQIHNVDNYIDTSDTPTHSEDSTSVKTDTLKSHGSSKFEFDYEAIKECALRSTTTNKTLDQETVEDGKSSTKTLKSILTTPTNDVKPVNEIEQGERLYARSISEIQETKNGKSHVKFSDDTVFHENRTSKHKREMIERLNLREMYRGKISSAAVAKLNPLFQDDVETVEGQGSMTDDEKVAYKISLKRIMDSKDAGTEGYEHPVFDKLIQRTIAKARRKLIIKWTLVLLTVGTITVVATLIGVHFKN